MTPFAASFRWKSSSPSTFAGGRRWRALSSLLFGFIVQSTHQLVARRRGYLTSGAYKLALAESLLGIAVWGGVAMLIGLVPYVIRLLIANAIVMAFILTNHGLSPRVEINDPLVSGLSLTCPRWIEWLTLKFGYHVEHHLFPSMSSRHAKTVCDGAPAVAGALPVDATHESAPRCTASRASTRTRSR